MSYELITKLPLWYPGEDLQSTATAVLRFKKSARYLNVAVISVIIAL